MIATKEVLPATFCLRALLGTNSRSSAADALIRGGTKKPGPLIVEMQIKFADETAGSVIAILVEF